MMSCTLTLSVGLSRAYDFLESYKLETRWRYDRESVKVSKVKISSNENVKQFFCAYLREKWIYLQ